MEAARERPDLAAPCLQAFVRGEDSPEAFTGAYLTAEFMHIIRKFLTK